MKQLDIQSCIHILDCTKVLVNLDNENYENSSVVKIDSEAMRGYKLGVLRGVLDDSGIAEEIVFGTLKTHDMEQCREMLKNTPCFHENDILINDRGFLSRDMANYLKAVRRVDTYIPARENMTVYQDAVKLAVTNKKYFSVFLSCTTQALTGTSFCGSSLSHSGPKFVASWISRFFLLGLGCFCHFPIIS